MIGVTRRWKREFKSYSDARVWSKELDATGDGGRKFLLP